MSIARARLRARPAWQLILVVYALAATLRAVLPAHQANSALWLLLALWIVVLVLRGGPLRILAAQILAQLPLRALGVHGVAELVLAGALVALYTVTVIERHPQGPYRTWRQIARIRKRREPYGG